MKNVFLALAFMLVGTFAFANNESKISNLLEINSSDKISLEINLGDITNLSQEEIGQKVSSFLEANLSADEALDCKVVVTGEINVGVGKIEVSVEVSGPCDEVRKSGRKIAKQILADIKDALSR